MPESEGRVVGERAFGRAGAWGAILWLVVASCGEGPEPAGREALPAFVTPSWSALEPDVRDALQETQARLDADLAAGVRDTDLGRRIGEQGRRYDTFALREPALSCYRLARRLDPDEPAWAYLLGSLQRDRGEMPQALVAFDDTVALLPDYVPAWIAIGEIHLDRGELDEAEEALQRALEADADAAAALFALGRVASARRDWDTAITHFEAALSLAPAASAIHYPLGLAYRARGDTQRAQELLARRGGTPVPLDDPLRDGGGASPASARTALHEANQALREGRAADAARLFRQVVEQDPGDIDAHLSLAGALVQSNDLVGAALEYDAVLAIEPDHPMARTGRGLLLFRQGRHPQAVADFEAALAREPDLLAARVYLGSTLATLGAYDQAAAHFARAVELDPRDAGVRYQEALTLLRAGRWGEARTAFERARQVLPQEQPLANGLVRLLASSPDDLVRDGPTALALAEALVAAEARPENLEVLALALAEVGRFDEAADVQRRLLAVVGASPPARMEENLARYEAGYPCLRAWPVVDPVAGVEIGTSAFTPPR